MKTYLKPIVIATSLMMSGAYASQSMFLNPVVVTGENSPSITQPSIDQAKARVKEIPGGASIVDMENVRESRTSTWVDMLGMAPGVFVQERFGSDEARVAIRGSGLSRTFHAFGLKVMQDGIPINYVDGNFDMQTVDASSARYVEVLRGANAGSYGSSTLGGAINLISSTGYDKRNLVRAEVGSFEYRRFQAQFGNYHEQADGKVFDYNISMGANFQNGYRDWSTQEGQKLVSNFGVKINQNLETRFYIAAANSNSQMPGALTKAQLEQNPRQSNSTSRARHTSRDLDSYRVANKTTYKDGVNTYEFSIYAMQQDLWHPNSGATVEQLAKTYGANLKWFNKNKLFGFNNTTQVAFLSSWGQNRQENYNYNQNNTRGSLASANLQTGRNQTWLLENITQVSNDFRLITALQYELAIRQQETLRSGGTSQAAAYDRSFEDLLPRLGFIYDLAKSHQLYGNVSRNFEAPIFGVDTGPGMVATQAQTGITYELGSRGDFSFETVKTLFGWDVAIYRSELKNEFQTRCKTGAVCNIDARNPSQTETTNIPRTIHQGIELGLNSLTNNQYETRTSLLVSDFKFNNDAQYGNNKMPGFPPVLIRSELLYRWGPSYGLRGLPGNYIGPKFEWAAKAPMDNTNSLYNEAYFLLGLKAGQQLDRSWSWFFDARNLTDKKYAPTTGLAASYTSPPAAYWPGDGRSFYFGIEKKLD